MGNDQTPGNQQQSVQKMADLCSSSSGTKNLLEKAIFILRGAEVDGFRPYSPFRGVSNSSLSVNCGSRKSNLDWSLSNDQSLKLGDLGELSHKGIVGYVDQSYTWSKYDQNSPSGYSSGSNLVEINDEEAERLGMVARKSSTKPLFKRPRVEKSNQPTALDTCQLGEKSKVTVFSKVTSLREIVSPFGKIATASVLIEAIEYIRFLHDQIEVLNRGSRNGIGGLLNVDREEEQGVKIQELKNRGLCLVPISSAEQLLSSSER